MARSFIIPVVFVAALAAACDRSPSPPPAPSPNPPGQVETITGAERLGWEQQAQDTAELSSFDFAMYVDGTRRVLEDATCDTGTSRTTFLCSASLAPLSAGQHTLELAAFVTSGSSVIEGARSPVLRVNVVAITASDPANASTAMSIVTSDGDRLHARPVAFDLDDPADLAIAPSGRVLVVERRGVLRTFRPRRAARDRDELQSTSAALSAGGDILSIALDPHFDRTGRIFIVQLRDRMFEIVRLREAGGVPGEAAVVHRSPAPARDPSALLRFGPDGALYVAYGAAGDPERAQDLASLWGKILRLNPDGTTPRDNPRASPVYSLGHHEPRGLAWQPRSARMYSIDRGETEDELNAIAAGANYGSPMTSGTMDYPGTTSALTVFPARTGVSAAAFTPALGAAPLAGRLLVAATDAQDLFSVRVGADGFAIAIEPLLHKRYGRIGGVAAGAAAVYAVTANRAVWGAGRDLLIAIRED